MKYIFGPVPSRRLGKSLGVDLIPYKVCTYDCIYCQVGRTNNKTSNRKSYNPTDKLLDELEKTLPNIESPDYITFSGSGEPTLHIDLDKIIDRIKKISDIPIAMITNSSLLWEKNLTDALMKVDLVVPSLDAGNQETFEKINRPASDITFDRMINGLIAFSNMYKGELWLEIFLAKDINTSQKDLEDIKRWLDEIRYDKIQLNTVVRPPAENFAHAVSKAEMEEIADFFGENVEIIADYSKAEQHLRDTTSAEEILTLLKRRPCTLDDIANGINIHRNAAVKYLDYLITENKITLKETEKGKYYFYKMIS